MTREVRTIRQKIDKRTSEALSQLEKQGYLLEAVGNSIHYFPGSLRDLANTLSRVSSALVEGSGPGKVLSGFHSRKAETLLIRHRTRLY